MRQRFKSSRLCSSDRYEESRKISATFHRSHSDESSRSIKRVSKHYFVNVFGKLLEVTQEELYRFDDSFEIIIK
jgi:hypothetical protein